MDKYRKKAIIEVVEETPDGFRVQNEGHPEDQWVIPRYTFEETYEPVQNTRSLCSVDVRITDLEFFQRLIKLVSKIRDDERLPGEMAEYITAELTAIMVQDK